MDCESSDLDVILNACTLQELGLLKMDVSVSTADITTLPKLTTYNSKHSARGKDKRKRVPSFRDRRKEHQKSRQKSKSHLKFYHNTRRGKLKILDNFSSHVLSAKHCVYSHPTQTMESILRRNGFFDQNNTSADG